MIFDRYVNLKYKLEKFYLFLSLPFYLDLVLI